MAVPVFVQIHKQDINTSGSSITVASVDVGSGTNRSLVAIYHWLDYGSGMSDRYPTGIVFNTSEAFTQASRWTYTYGGNQYRITVEVWYLDNPTNATADVVATLNSALDNALESASLSVMEYTGANNGMITPSTQGGSGNTADASMAWAPAAADNLMILGVRKAGNSDTPSGGTGTTLRRADVDAFVGEETATGTASQTINATWLSACRTAWAGAELKAAAGGSPQTLTATALTFALSLATATLSASATLSATALALSATLPTATLSPGQAALSASALPFSLTLPDATLSPGQAAIEATPLALSLNLPVTDIILSIALEATPLSFALSLPTATISPGEAAIVSTPLPFTLSLPDATLVPGQAALSATPLPFSLTLPEASLFSGITLEAAPLSFSLTLPDTTLSASASLSATPLSFSLTLPTATLFASTSLSVTPLAATVYLPDATISTVSDQTVTATPLALAVYLPSADLYFPGIAVVRGPEARGRHRLRGRR